MAARFLTLAILATTALAIGGTETPHSAGPNDEFDRARRGSFRNGQPPTGPLRVMTWNIERGYHLDRVEATLSEKEPGLCLLQEVDDDDRRTADKDVAVELAKKLGYDYAFGAAFEELSQSVGGRPAYQGQATLSRWPITAARILRFKRQSGWWKPHGWIPNTAFFQRRLGGRIALVTELAVSSGRIVVYNLHLESRSGGAIQSAQLREVFDDLSRYPAGTPAIIGGDFNSKYHPFELLHTMEKDGFHSVLGEHVGRTHVIAGYLDWIFYRGPWETMDGIVVRGTHASDHDAVFAELSQARQARPRP
jgi:endonuclease/exonuclease/phosphatase family metal-dependent hydrolase